MAVGDKKAFVSGIGFLAFGIFTLAISSRYPLGTARVMGPGYFPIMLSSVLIAISIPIVLRSLRNVHGGFGTIAIVPVVLVSAGCVAFMLLLRPAGLIIALVAAMMISALATRGRNWIVTVPVVAAIAIACGLVFVKGLGQPLPLLGYWFGG